MSFGSTFPHSIAALEEIARGGEILGGATPRHALVGDPNGHRNRQRREHAQVAGDAFGIRGGVPRRRRLDEQQAPAEPAAHLEHRLRDVDLVRVHAAVETFEIAQRL
jgi:hypothetical protein